MLVIDGSIGEGGGQILRTALGLAAVLRKPIKVINIRAKRRNPGLQRQHLTGVKAIATLTNARIEGAYLGSTSLYFEPRGLRCGEFVFDVGTAGSVTLVLQTLLPVLPYLPCRSIIEIRGGTDVPWSPPVDYIRYVFIPLARLCGVEIELELIRRGHYPRGGGIIKLYIEPTHSLNSIELAERGALKTIKGRSHCVKLPKHVAERQARAAYEYLYQRLKIPMDIEIEFYDPDKDPHLGPGSGIVLYAITEKSILGADSLGAKGKPAEQVGQEAAIKLIEELESNAAVDRHAADMLVPLMVLAKGRSVVTASKLTLHTMTVIEIAKSIIPEAVMDVSTLELGKPVRIEVEGIGLEL